MYGFISNNLKIQIRRYLESKLMDVTYQHTEPINEVNTIVDLIDVDTLIIDSTCFYDDQCVIDFCYKLKIKKPKIRIIIISFNAQLITNIAMLGIYDIINYQKKIDLNKELDEILFNPKTLSDLQMYLNTDIIKNKASNCRIIGGLSYEGNSYLTTFLLNYLSIHKGLKVCYCESSNTKTSLVNYFGAQGYATISKFHNEKFNYLGNDIIFCDTNKIKKDQVLTLLLNLKNKYDIVVFDLGSMPQNKGNEEIILNCEELIILKSNNIFNNYQGYEQYNYLCEKTISYIDYKLLYDKNINDLKSDVIDVYLKNNYKIPKEQNLNLKADVISLFGSIKLNVVNKSKKERNE